MKTKSDYYEILEKCRVDNTTKIPDDNIYLCIGMNVIGSTGNFVTFTGLPKSSKSTFICCVIASAISRNEIYNFKVLTYPHKNKDRIALFDTEQSLFDFTNKLKFIKKLAKVENIYQKFDAFTVVEHDSNTILHLIKTYLEQNQDCAILIIDGLLDLINNFNDERESKALIKLIRKWAKIYDILIITVLHLGKKDNMAIGHLGSASSRYCQSELDRKSTRLNSSHVSESRMPSSA